MTIAAGAGAPAQGRDRGRSEVRPLHPRPLCDRRLALPDDAAGRGHAAHRRGGGAGDRASRARRACQRAAARRRHLAMRADRQLIRWSSIARSISTASSISMSRAAAAWSSPASCSTISIAQLKPHGAVVSGRYLDRVARHHRRHERRTIPAARARCATAPRAKMCSSIDAMLADGTAAHFGPVARAICPNCRPIRRCARWRAICSRIGAREADEIETRFPKVQRRVGGYNLDALRARTQRAQSRAYPDRLGGHARLLHPHRAEALARARQAARSAPAISAASTRRWMPPSIS